MMLHGLLFEFFPSYLVSPVSNVCSLVDGSPGGFVNTLLGSQPTGCKFDPSSQQLHEESGSALLHP